uniref:Uncharacterized protein n=1 Tax=Oryza nivara TaxID=4536 RepID=A0A0E0GXP3_ORYNI
MLRVDETRLGIQAGMADGYRRRALTATSTLVPAACGSAGGMPAAAAAHADDNFWVVSCVTEYGVTSFGIALRRSIQRIIWFQSALLVHAHVSAPCGLPLQYGRPAGLLLAWKCDLHARHLTGCLGARLRLEAIVSTDNRPTHKHSSKTTFAIPKPWKLIPAAATCESRRMDMGGIPLLPTKCGCAYEHPDHPRPRGGGGGAGVREAVASVGWHSGEAATRRRPCGGSKVGGFWHAQ